MMKQRGRGPSEVLFLVLVSGSVAFAQDVDVPGNLTMTDSSATQGNVLKSGVPFIHNFGMNNTFVGANAGNFTMSSVYAIGNTAVGANALNRNGTYGGYNTATGYQALFSNSDGNSNTASGAFALQSNVFGSGNTGSGFQALLSNDYGHDNTATGAKALRDNTSGGSNTATGTSALLHNTYGNSNTATGAGALSDNTSGWGNTASGVAALLHNAAGTNNTAIGFRALLTNINGGSNTAIGVEADVSAGNLTNATAIGANAVVNASNKIRLGNSSVTLIEGQGDFHASGAGNGIILKSPNGAVCARLSIDNSGQLVTTDVTCP